MVQRHVVFGEIDEGRLDAVASAILCPSRASFLLWDPSRALPAKNINRIGVSFLPFGAHRASAPFGQAGRRRTSLSALQRI